MARVDDSEVLRYLTAMDYPADRDDVVREAQRAGAPPEVLRALRAMPPVDYHNSAEVARSAATDPAPDESPASLAAKTREPHRRVARHLRRI